jgi:uncharacterized protein YciI
MNRILTRLLVASALALPAATQPADLYYLVFLRPSPDRKPLPKEQAEKIQADHMANIRAMADRGVLVAAGPFGDTPPTISGVFVFKTSSMEEARRIASADPTVVERRNTVEVYAWRGPGGIGEEYRRLHKADPKTPEGMGVQPFVMFRRGPAWDRLAEFAPAHREHLARLRREGKIAAAGPVEGDPDLAAVFVFQRMPDEEARRLAEEDPFVKAGVVRIETHRWWCAAHVLPGW